MRRGNLAIAGAALAVAVAGGVLVLGRGSTGATATYSSSRVSVSVRVIGAGDRRTLEAVFTPDTPDLHLYGPDLPTEGIDGAGRPTRVNVTGGGWRAVSSSPETESVVPTPFPTVLPGFSAPFSILPPGAVTLRVPIEATSGNRGTVEVAVTYMACSIEGRCFAPVEAQPMTVSVP